MTIRVVVASKNPDKIAEIEAVLHAVGGFEIVRGVDWPDVPETAETLEGNALLKATAVASATGLSAIADDTGLEVDALGGAPGVRTARYAGPEASYADNVVKLLGDLETSSERGATFRTVIAMVAPNGEAIVVEGALEGAIARVPRGEGGFGYDPVFEVGGLTLAELPTGVKNSMSHRALALRALADALNEKSAPAG